MTTIISEKVEETKKMQTKTEDHVTHCSIKVAEKMTDSEITDFANECNSRMLKSAAYRAVNGIHNRTGAKLTDKNIAADKVETIRNISGHINNVIAGRI